MLLHLTTQGPCSRSFRSLIAEARNAGSHSPKSSGDLLYAKLGGITVSVFFGAAGAAATRMLGISLKIFLGHCFRRALRVIRITTAVIACWANVLGVDIGCVDEGRSVTLLVHILA